MDDQHADRLRGIPAGSSLLKPGEHREGALGIGAGGLRHDQHVESLARDSKDAGEFDFLTAATELPRDRGSKFVP
jgi:hypothetical protein